MVLAIRFRALTVLPRRKHVAVIQKHGILEYKSGFPERGRTIFEGLLSSEPKRSDLWSVYIDQEIASGELRSCCFDPVRTR